MSGELSWVPPEIDTTVPNPARVYDFWLDGDHNFAADRALGEQILKIMPGVRDAARLNRAFLRRAAKFMVDSGVRQFLDIGSGIPTVGNLHEIVQQADPSCRVVYVDRESVAVAHSELLLQENENCLVLQADLRDVNDIFAGAGELLDLSGRSACSCCCCCTSCPIRGTRPASCPATATGWRRAASWR